MDIAKNDSHQVIAAKGEKMVCTGKIIGVSLMIAGTCIGAGMIGLPVSTAAGGFWPAIGLFVVAWLLMMFSALAMLEVSLCFPGDTNLITMARRTLGKKGEILAWLTYVLFLYCLLAAYTASGSALLGQGLSHFLNLSMHHTTSAVLFSFFLGWVIYMGTRSVDLINRIFIVGLVASYGVMITKIMPHVEAAKLAHSYPKYLWAAVPIITTSFGFHLLIPSLKTYMHEHINKLRAAIIIGSTIPLLVYIFWELTIVGVIPSFGSNSLTAMFTGGEPVVPLTQALDTLIGNNLVSVGVRGFSFFAIVSSFLGAALGLFDFLSDGMHGFHLKNSSSGKIILSVLSLLPPLIFSLTYPQGFVLALSYAGVFGAILLVLYPSLMAKKVRKLNLSTHRYQVIGGNILLNLAILAAITVVVLELLQQMQLLPTP